MVPNNLFDAYAPAQMAERVETAGVAKARLPLVPTITLAFLAGAFIAFGAMFFTLVMSGATLGFGLQRLVGGLAFSLGLILVIVGGAELFTGNNLIVMAWADRKITLWQLSRNWGLVYIGNLAGAIGVAIIAVGAGAFDNDLVRQTAAGIAEGKIALPFMTAFLRGVLCNVLVCLAVWLCFAAHSVSGKILATIFPISAFVALGFEHSVANMYFIPAAMFAGIADIGMADFLRNLIPVTLGNIVGGSIFVALAYWLIYLRKTP